MSGQAAGAADAADAADVADAPSEAQSRVLRPGELWRLGASLYAVRDEIDRLESVDDETLLGRLAELEPRVRDELVAILPDPMSAEVHRYFDWLGEGAVHSSELRIGLAQLSGWLDGLISDLGDSVDEAAATWGADSAGAGGA